MHARPVVGDITLQRQMDWRWSVSHLLDWKLICNKNHNKKVSLCCNLLRSSSIWRSFSQTSLTLLLLKPLSFLNHARIHCFWLAWKPKISVQWNRHPGQSFSPPFMAAKVGCLKRWPVWENYSDVFGPGSTTVVLCCTVSPVRFKDGCCRGLVTEDSLR